MKEYEEGIRLAKGASGGDCTAPYYITFERQMTVKEFIEKQLKDIREFGTFDIINKSTNETYYVGYTKGKLVSYNNSDEIPCSDKIVKECGGSGGWGRSDFRLFV